MLEVIRSPARVSWMVMFNDVLIITKDTKVEAEQARDKYAKKFGLKVKS